MFDDRVYIGKKVIADLEKMADDDHLFWNSNHSGGGKGHVNLDYRSYLSNNKRKARDSFDERENWSIQTGVDFTVSDEGCIESLDCTVRVFATADSGLGEESAYDHWTSKDDKLEKEFFDLITKRKRKKSE